MQTVTDSMLPLGYGTVITIGNFDGVHRGHQALIGEVCRVASETSFVPLVWTFREHPNSFLKENKKSLICTADEKIRLIGDAGAQRIYSADFNRYREMEPEAFVKNVICGAFNAKTVVCGYDFRFGANAGGDTEFLREYLRGTGVNCEIMPPFRADGITVSSTEIRKRLSDGDIETVTKLLGRNYGFDLPVIHGLENGRKLGFRTVNQAFPAELAVPCRGVYAVRCKVNGKTYNGVANIGTRPTVDENAKEVLCETHLFDFDGDVYGQTIRTELIKMIRKEKRFDSLDGLRAQVNDDILRVKLFFDGM